MSLDIVELVLSVEEAFGLTIPDDDAVPLATPGLLIDYLTRRLPPGEGPHCLSQRAFHRLRGALCEQLHVPRAAVRPGTDLRTLLPPDNLGERWAAVGNALGADTYWPRLPRRWWLGEAYAPTPIPVAYVVRQMADYSPRSLVREGEGWTRPLIAAVLQTILHNLFGFRRDSYTEDSHFCRDMGID
jgi:hypothetical protein